MEKGNTTKGANVINTEEEMEKREEKDYNEGEEGVGQRKERSGMSWNVCGGISRLVTIYDSGCCWFRSLEKTSSPVGELLASVLMLRYSTSMY